VVSVTDPYGRILGFLDRSRYFFFQVAPQLYSRASGSVEAAKRGHNNNVNVKERGCDGMAGTMD
jgi:hypothetical protein